jgi:hypothetical protein
MGEKHSRSNNLRKGIMTKVIKCKCQNKHQDEIHGAGNRVHNNRGDPDKNKASYWKCTVCGDCKPK